MANKINDRQLLDLETKLITLKERGYSISLIARECGWCRRRLNKVIEGNSVSVNVEEYGVIAKYYERFIND